MSSDREIKVIGIVDKPVEENQTPLMTSDKKSIYASGNILILQERDIPKLFKDTEMDLTGDSDILFVPDDVVRVWIGQNT